MRSTHEHEIDTRSRCTRSAPHVTGTPIPAPVPAVGYHTHMRDHPSGSSARRGNDATARLIAVRASRSPEALIAALDDTSPEVAKAAVARLVEVSSAGAADELRARLLDADLSLVPTLAAALRAIGDADATRLALDALSAPGYSHRLTAAVALGVLRDGRAAGPLRGALADEIAGVRAAALDALAQLGQDDETAACCATLLGDADVHVRIEAVRAVARTGRRPGTLLAHAADDRDRIVRIEVARHLGALPPEPADRLLCDPDLRVREAAAQRAGSPHLRRLKLLLTDDPAADVRHAAATTLGTIDAERDADAVTTALVEALRDLDAVVRAAALRSLQTLYTDAGVVALLCRELSEIDAQRRRAALYALAHLEPPALDRAGASGTPADSFEPAHPEDSSEHPDGATAKGAGNPETGASAAVSVAGDSVTRVSDSVAALVDDPDPDVRLALTQTADTLIRNPGPLILQLASDPDPAVQHAAEMWLLRHPSDTSPTH